MAGIRLPVGTRKGAFVLTADGRRRHWKVNGPHFPGWEVDHLKGSPADPRRHDGMPHSWEFKRAWLLEPSHSDPGTLLAGIEDAALVESTDGVNRQTRHSRQPSPTTKLCY